MVGKPILFSGIGEKLDALEPFYPDRLASRILGMGDVLSLIDKVQQNVEQKEAETLQQAFQKQQFTLEEFQRAAPADKKHGLRSSSLLEMIPGGKKLASQVDAEKAEKELKRVEAIIHSMTIQERRNPALLNGSRQQAHRQRKRHDGHRYQSFDETVFGDEKNDAEGQQAGRPFAPEPDAQPFPLTGEGRNSMSVTIRMSRHGAKKKPFYRIVVSDQRFPRDGRYIEQVGTYDPRAKTGGVKMDREKIAAWIKKGAKPCQTVSELIKKEPKELSLAAERSVS